MYWTPLADWLRGKKNNMEVLKGFRPNSLSEYETIQAMSYPKSSPITKAVLDLHDGCNKGYSLC